MSWRWMLAIFVVSLLLRAGFGVVRLTWADDPSALEFPDERQYWLMASSLRSGHGLTDELGFRATRMPLYPALLSPFTGTRHGVIAAKVSHWLLGAMAAVLTAGLAASLFDRRVGIAAGLLVAADPFLVFFSSLLLTETLFLVILVGLWWTAAQIFRERTAPVARWAAVGALAALCVYLRESSPGLVILAMGFVLVGRRFHRRASLGVAVVGAIVVMALTPWAARNQRVIGQWCWLTTRGGISLYDGVGPQATGASDLGDVKRMPAVADLTEIEWNRYFLRESIEAIKHQPGRILRLAAVKLGRTWNPFPNLETYGSPLVRAVAAAWSLPVYALAIAGALGVLASKQAVRIRTVLWLILPALYVSALHCLFVGSVRYRLGAMPMIEILAAFALTGLADRLRRAPAPPETAHRE